MVETKRDRAKDVEQMRTGMYLSPAEAEEGNFPCEARKWNDPTVMKQYRRLLDRSGDEPVKWDFLQQWSSAVPIG
jgi:hypothetical protein